MNQYKDPYEPISIMESEIFFFRGSFVCEALRLLHVLCAATHSAPSLGFSRVPVNRKGACAATTNVKLPRPKEHMHETTRM